jgi:hypothetical protein
VSKGRYFGFIHLHGANTRDTQPSPSLIALTERHVVLKTTLEQEHQIHLIANDILCDYWTPTISVDAHSEFAVVSAADIPKLSTFVDTAVDQSFTHISVVGSPLQDDNYRVWIHGTLYSSNTRSIVGYQLSIPVGGQPEWRRRIRASEVALYMAHTVPYSGHTISHATLPSYTIYPPTSSFKTLQVTLPFNANYIHVAPYSGALTYSTDTSIVIQYYK